MTLVHRLVRIRESAGYDPSSWIRSCTMKRTTAIMRKEYPTCLRCLAQKGWKSEYVEEVTALCDACD